VKIITVAIAASSNCQSITHIGDMAHESTKKTLLIEVEALYNSQDRTRRDQANAWLQTFQKTVLLVLTDWKRKSQLYFSDNFTFIRFLCDLSIEKAEAWTITDQLLREPNITDSARYIAARTLRQKVQNVLPLQ